MQDAMHYSPKLPMRKDGAEDLKAVFLSKDQHAAQEKCASLGGQIPEQGAIIRRLGRKEPAGRPDDLPVAG